MEGVAITLLLNESHYLTSQSNSLTATTQPYNVHVSRGLLVYLLLAGYEKEQLMIVLDEVVNNAKCMGETQLRQKHTKHSIRISSL